MAKTGPEYNINLPPAGEILTDGESQMNAYYKDGLKLAVEEGKMTPKVAKEYYYQWTGVYLDFN